MTKKSLEDSTEVLDQLAKARALQQDIVERETAKLDDMNKMIAVMQSRMDGTPMPESLEFAALGLTDAAERLLAEPQARKGLTTREVSDELKRRGIVTKSANYSAAVFATLRNSSPDNERCVAPRFRRKDNLWFLNKGR